MGAKGWGRKANGRQGHAPIDQANSRRSREDALAYAPETDGCVVGEDEKTTWVCYHFLRETQMALGRGELALWEMGAVS